MQGFVETSWDFSAIMTYVFCKLASGFKRDKKPCDTVVQTDRTEIASSLHVQFKTEVAALKMVQKLHV